jgi:hypothetical protein
MWLTAWIPCGFETVTVTVTVCDVLPPGPVAVQV